MPGLKPGRLTTRPKKAKPTGETSAHPGADAASDSGSVSMCSHCSGRGVVKHRRAAAGRGSAKPLSRGRGAIPIGDVLAEAFVQALQQPKSARVYFRYPHPEGQVASSFTGQLMKKLLAVATCTATVTMPYSVSQLHWHELFVSFRGKVVYHFEAFGEPLERRGAILRAFGASLAPKGWALISLRAKFQADSSSCGVWLQVVRDIWLCYEDSDLMGSKSFECFLEQELATDGVRNLYKEPRAGANSRKLILGQLADMCGRLVQAALDSKLRHEAASLAGFAPSVALDLDLEEFDDDDFD